MVDEFSDAETPFDAGLAVIGRSIRVGDDAHDSFVLDP